jgi:hypothetical protein
MWAVAVYDLRLTSDAFFALTPRQYDALLKRKEHETRTTEFLFAQLTACGINFSPCHPKEPTSPADFMPSEWVKKQASAAPKRVRMTKKVKQQVTDSIRAGFGALLARPRGVNKNA